MNPVRLGFVAVTLIALLLVAARVVPALIQLLFDIVPGVLIITLILLVLSSMVRRLLQ